MNEIPEALRAELDAFLTQPEAGINCADVSETKAADWVDAERGKFLRAKTQNALSESEHLKAD